jgi:hypothetical protein
MTPYLVVGAGPSGLGCAATLARGGQVLLFDRIPVTGGTAGWADPNIRRVTRALIADGVQLRLGECALRWDGRHLLVASPGRCEQIEGQHLFFAGGLRPATVANLHIAGDRPAGVLPGTVAEHLLQAGVKLWRAAAIVGDGRWAQTVARECRHLGTRIIAVGGTADCADECHDWPEQFTVLGRDRVTHLRLDTADGQLDIPCDAIILAADPRPNRNIEGALLNGAPGVTYLQPIRPYGPSDRYHAGQQAAREWLTPNGDPP